jgi:hypothetical protein
VRDGGLGASVSASALFAYTRWQGGRERFEAPGNGDLRVECAEMVEKIGTLEEKKKSWLTFVFWTKNFLLDKTVFPKF